MWRETGLSVSIRRGSWVDGHLQDLCWRGYIPKRQEQWRPWGESGGVGPLSEGEDELGTRKGGGVSLALPWRYAGWSWLNGKASSIIRRY